MRWVSARIRTVILFGRLAFCASLSFLWAATTPAEEIAYVEWPHWGAASSKLILQPAPGGTPKVIAAYPSDVVSGFDWSRSARLFAVDLWDTGRPVGTTTRMSFLDRTGRPAGDGTLAPQGPEHSPAWSPNGRLLAVARTWRVHVLDPATGMSRHIETTGSQDQYPTWSPDGRRIAFSSNWDARFWAAPDQRSVDIHVFGIDGDHVRNVTQSVEDELEAAWSPTGRHMAYIQYRGGDAHGVVRILDLSTDRAWDITEPTVHLLPASPDWSADGQQIAFVAGERRDDTRLGRNVYTADLTGDHIVKITDYTARAALSARWVDGALPAVARRSATTTWAGLRKP